MKVYVVSSGSYSDRHINAIFDNKEQAEKAQQYYTDYAGEINGIEEYELNAMPQYPPGLFPWAADIDEHGKIHHVQRTSAEDFKEGFYVHENYGTDGDTIHLSVWAKDKAHVVKVVSEKLAQFLASGELAEAYKRYLEHERQFGRKHLSWEEWKRQWWG